jgi:anti-sigma B factor antagonist
MRGRMSIRVRTLQSGTIAIIDVRGSLVGDGDTDLLREAVADFVEQGIKCLVINLQKVTYVNSSGIGSIIAAHATYAKNGGEVKLAGISSGVQNLLVITKLIDIFDVYDTVDEAAQSFGKINSIT